MSITGINGTSAITRIATPVSGAAAASGSTRAAATPAAPSELQQQEGTDAKPTTIRFPWLSRLSAKLEAASNQRARFPTQFIGDHVDRKA